MIRRFSGRLSALFPIFSIAISFLLRDSQRVAVRLYILEVF